MAENDEQEYLEMDDVLNKVVAYAIDEAKTKLIETAQFEPFTIIVEGDNMHIETYPGDVEIIRNNARDQIKTASSFATHYIYCYDGYIDTDAGTLDAIICECAERDQDVAYAIAQIYKENGDELVFEEELAYIGEAEMFFDAATVAKAEDDEFKAAQQELEREEIRKQAAERLKQMESEQ